VGDPDHDGRAVSFEQPGAADLLATAREVVLKELLPALPPEKVFAARMVANAIAIALREHAAAPMPARDLAAPARDIRAGAHDPGSATHAEVAVFLRDYARKRAMVSAPKVLPPPPAGEGRGGGS
jgi:hypothetical protein